MTAVSTNLPEIGQAYRCPDGVVRWIQRRDSHGAFHCLWLDDATGHWHRGASIKAGQWVGGIPADAPKIGETYMRVNVMGFPEQFTRTA